MSDSETDTVVAASTAAEPIPMPPRRRWGRTVLRLILLVAIPAAAVFAGGYWYQATGRYVTTENAYVKAHVIAVSPNIDGRVTDVFVKENQRVNAGDVLFKLDAEPYWMMVRMSEAKRETARQDIESTRAEYHQIVAEIEEAKANVRYYESEAARQRKLASKAITTRTRLDEAEFNLTGAKQVLATRRQKIRTVLARLGGDPKRGAELHPNFMVAETEKAIAELKLGYTEIRAPADGIVTRLKLEPGEWVEEGEPAFGLIAIDETWIEANLKETQLTYIRDSQDVTVEIDAYPDVIWKARVASISPATGAEFSVLPPQNASGNWVKVVQRLPVRIEIETTPEHPPLRAGMTATVTVDTHHKRELWKMVKKAIAGLGAIEDVETK
jgi:membrane fusion protein (multidrug efflux system)